MNAEPEEYDVCDSYPYLLKTCGKLLGESLNRMFQQAGYAVTLEQWSVLVHLWHEDGLTQQALADRNSRSKVAAFKIIEKLERQGLVVRRRDPGDGRSRRVFLTPEGLRIQAEIVPLAEKNAARMIRGVGDEDLETFKKVLRTIIGNADSGRRNDSQEFLCPETPENS